MGGLLGHAAAASKPKGLQVGDAFPDLARFQLEGNVPKTLKGRVTVVDFWASWCGPCKDSFPVMEDLYRRFGSTNLTILAINVDESRPAMELFLEEHPVTFTVLRDQGKKLVAAVNIPSMPTSFVLNQEGKVHAIHQGFYTTETKKKYIHEIEELLGPGTTKDK
jgi:thiol-disulfide isomerase/thioredoxin